jgi:hypothetical protein
MTAEAPSNADQAACKASRCQSSSAWSRSISRVAASLSMGAYVAVFHQAKANG